MEESEVITKTGIENAGVSNEEIWKAHILQAKSFMGADAEYCRRNGLSPSTFKVYKSKYGEKKQRGPYKKAFVRMEPQNGPVPVSPVRPERRQGLPDAKWTAEFVTALMAGR